MKSNNLALAIILTILFGHLTAQNTVIQHESGSCVDQIELTILNVDETIQISDPPVKEIRGNYTPPSELNPEVYKNVFFVHGLGGHSASWAPATRHVSTTYKAYTPEVNYSQDVTIPQAATWLSLDFGEANQLLEYDHPDSKGEESIYIGHSMGGIVGRQLDYDRVTYNQMKRFNAMATFGSPHQGAKIIESLQNGNIEQYLNQGCEAVTVAMLANLEANLDVQLKGIWGVLFNERIINLEKNMFGFLEDFIKNYGCTELVDMGFPSLANDIAPPIGAALNPNSELISTLGSHQIEIDNVAFFGVEKGTYELKVGEGVDGYAALRQLHSLNKMSAETDFGGENEDESYITDYINLKNFLMTQYSYYSYPLEYQYSLVLPPWSNPLNPDHEKNAECIEIGGTPVLNYSYPPTYMMTCDLPYDPVASGAFRKAYQFVSDFDKEYRILFGHLTVDFLEIGQRPVCECFNVHNGKRLSIDIVPCEESLLYLQYLNNPNVVCNDTYIPVYDYKETLHAGDCVVVETSASNFPGVKKTRKLPDNNHQQMRNSREAKEYFRELFKGNEFGPGFKLNLKDN